VALRRGRPDGIRALIPLGTSRFVETPVPRITPRRVGVLAIWDADADVDARWAARLGTAAARAREHWRVEGEVVRAAFTEPWRGWTPDVDGVVPMDPDEPALILISGNLRPRYAPVFFSDAARAVTQAFGQPGYLGGLALASSPTDTTSCSAWRRYADARAYAFRPGAHATAMRRDKAGRHHRTEHFLRVRPLAERGTLDGAAPFGALLAGRRPAAV
jgi:hypothetical protein